VSWREIIPADDLDELHTLHVCDAEGLLCFALLLVLYAEVKVAGVRRQGSAGEAAQQGGQVAKEGGNAAEPRQEGRHARLEVQPG
jgi:hypothetical protein